MSTDSPNSSSLEDITHTETDAATSINLLPTPQPPRGPAPFMTLPFEIRKIIYEDLFKLGDARSADTPWDPSQSCFEWWWQNLPSGSHPQILATCRLINTEAKDLLYSCNIMNVGIKKGRIYLRPTRNTCFQIDEYILLDSSEPVLHNAHLFKGFKILLLPISPHCRKSLGGTRGAIMSAMWFCRQVLLPCHSIKLLEIYLDVTGLLPVKVDTTLYKTRQIKSSDTDLYSEYFQTVDNIRDVSIWDYVEHLRSQPASTKTCSHHILDAFREVRRVEKGTIIMGEHQIPMADLDKFRAVVTRKGGDYEYKRAWRLCSVVGDESIEWEDV